jgi:hypothetical protein
MEFASGEDGAGLLHPRGVPCSDVRLAKPRRRPRDGRVRPGGSGDAPLLRAAGDNESLLVEPDGPDREGERTARFNFETPPRAGENGRAGRKGESAGFLLVEENGAMKGGTLVYLDARRAKKRSHRHRGHHVGAVFTGVPRRACDRRDPLLALCGQGSLRRRRGACGTWKRKCPPPEGSTMSGPSPSICSGERAEDGPAPTCRGGSRPSGPSSRSRGSARRNRWRPLRGNGC